MTACAEQWNIPKDTARGLTMKSRHLAASPILRPDRTARQGVVVFESTADGGLSMDTVREYLKQSADELSWLVHTSAGAGAAAEKDL